MSEPERKVDSQQEPVTEKKSEKVNGTVPKTAPSTLNADSDEEDNAPLVLLKKRRQFQKRK